MTESLNEKVEFDTSDDDVRILEGQLTDSNKPPEVTAAPKEEATPEAPPLPSPGKTRLITQTASLTAGSPPVMLRGPDATRGSVHFVAKSATATDRVRIASSVGDVSNDATAFLLPVGALDVAVLEYTGAVWGAVAAGGTGPVEVTMLSVVN